MSEIEKKIEFDEFYQNKLYSKFVEAIEKYELIKNGDRIGVCISGGKDSMLMADLFKKFKKLSLLKFEIVFLVMNPGYNENNLNLIKNNLKRLEIDAIIEDTNIFEVSNSMSANPCFLCAKMRRGALYRILEKNGCNKIALGHHFDDVIVTNLMNLINSGSFQTMLPKLHSQNYNSMELIRPLYLIREEDVIFWKDYLKLTFLQCACKYLEMTDTHKLKSQREFTKQLIKRLKKDIPNIEDNLFSCTEKVNINRVLEFKIENERISYKDIFDNKFKEFD